jgi:sec-independent protein translocase protein TatB
MFDIGFWEIAVIAVVALLVVGPEEFPALVRTLGSWLGKIRGFMNDAKSELEQEVSKAEELKRLIEQETKIAELHKIAEEANTRIPIDNDTRKKLNDSTDQSAADRSSNLKQTPQSASKSPNGASKEISS